VILAALLVGRSWQIWQPHPGARLLAGGNRRPTAIYKKKLSHVKICLQR